eukprot:scaffold25979_cov30-Tisochrysis_lutea.AAC.3
MARFVAPTCTSPHNGANPLSGKRWAARIVIACTCCNLRDRLSLLEGDAMLVWSRIVGDGCVAPAGCIGGGGVVFLWGGKRGVASELHLYQAAIGYVIANANSSLCCCSLRTCQLRQLAMPHICICTMCAYV